MKNFLFFTLLFCLPQLVMSQGGCNKWSFGADFNFVKPLEDLNTGGFGNNFGVNLDFIYNGGHFSGIRLQPGIRLVGGVSQGRSENFIIDLPGEPTGESTIRNAMGGLEFIGRLVTDQNKRFKAYLEGFIGARISGATRRITLDNNYEDWSSEGLNTKVSEVIGFRGGILIGLNEYVDLNIRAGMERSGRMGYYDVVSDPYPFEGVETNKAVNASFGIGVLIRIDDCGQDEDVYHERNDIQPSSNYRYKRGSSTPYRIKNQSSKNTKL